MCVRVRVNALAKGVRVHRLPTALFAISPLLAQAFANILCYGAHLLEIRCPVAVERAAQAANRTGGADTRHEPNQLSVDFCVRTRASGKRLG